MECQHHLFSLPEGQHYLNCAYMSPLLKTVEAAGIAGLKRKAVPASITTPDFFGPVEELRDLFARLINTSPERVALVPSASYGVAIATHNLPLRPGQNLVVPGEEFPSAVYGWMTRCHQDGAELRFVDRPADVQSLTPAWNNRVLEAIDHNTAVVILSSVHWTDGTPFDLDQIGQRAREVGALFIVDGTQSVGAAPFDFASVQPDLLVCAGYKWLFGPYQYSFAVVGDRLIEGEPFEHNWINRNNSQDFSALVNYQPGYQPGARRFDSGERSNFIMVPMMIEALQQILAWDVEKIRDYCAMLGRALEQALENSPYSMPCTGQRSAHLFGIRVPDAKKIPSILAELNRREVYVSQRGTSVRVSPHVYNTPEDMIALAEALRAVTR